MRTVKKLCYNFMISDKKAVAYVHCKELIYLCIFRISNVTAVAVMSLAAFIYGFFA